MLPFSSHFVVHRYIIDLLMIKLSNRLKYENYYATI